MTGNAGFDPSRVVREPTYNIGTGARILTEKWRTLAHSIGENDPLVVEDWYYAVWAYNGFSWYNNPNRNCPPEVTTCTPSIGWNPNRPPFSGNDLVTPRSWYPYQELIWGWATNPLSYQGSQLYPAVPLTLPPRSTLLTSPGLPPPLHISRPLPAHTGCGVVNLPATYRAACAEPLQNGGFEGPFFQGWSRTNNILLATVAQDGNHSALLGGYNNPNPNPYSVPVDILSQDFVRVTWVL